MILREATINDIQELHRIRVAVNENRLSNPDLITAVDYKEYLTQRGKGWLCEIDSLIVGFVIVDLKESNVWALFIHPMHEGKGIGKSLQKIMLTWYFSQTTKKVRLGTAPYSRAEKFYSKTGWKKIGLQPNGEVLFELTFNDWTNY